MSQIIKQLKPAFEEKVSPVVDFLYKTGISPNFLTFSGLIFVALGSYLIVTGNFIPAGIFLTIGNLCDALDGTLARKSGKETVFGAFIDSVIDRVSDAIPLIAIIYILRDDNLLFFIACFTVIFSFLVSYTKARAEGLGIECNKGLFERPERSIILIISIFTGLIETGIYILFIGSLFTAVQRIFCVYNKTKQT